MKRHPSLALILAAVMLLGLPACGAAAPDAGTATGTQTVVIEGFDWGPAVTKTILSLDRAVTADSVSVGAFSVAEKRESLDGLPLGIHFSSKNDRTILAAYPCDANGEAVDGASSMIALEMAYAPSTGSPFCYGLMTSVNTYCDPYELTVSLTEGSTLTAEDGSEITGLSVEKKIDLGAALIPQLDRVDLSGSYTGADGKTLTYAAYSPAGDGAKHPLVIWLHGAGEGGTDASIPVLGNKVTALFGEEFQSIMGGAYVLSPQTDGFWLAYQEKGEWDDNPGTDSIYLTTLMELIESYVDSHEDIDTDRIYVGGCSNGGFMTMDLILNYPNYFAAAYPICEAYLDEGITDAQLEGIKDLPIWFVYAKNDETVDPETHEVPTISRLRAIGADVHTSVFDDTHDTSGLYTDDNGGPYQYQGHWSWLYFFNNECEEDGVSLWQWLAEQHK